MYTINEIMPNWSTYGIISAIMKVYDTPWKDSATATYLDADYHAGHSGNKFVSTLIDTILDTDTTLSDTKIDKIANIIVSRYKSNWGTLWYTMIATYDPLKNYQYLETYTESTKDTGTVTDSGAINYGKVDSTSTNRNNSDSSGKYGFNSSVSSPYDTASGTESSSGTDTLSGADSSSNLRTDNLAHSRDYTLNKDGNIGVVIPQKMIEAEREARMWNFFEEVLYPDIDNVMTISIY